MRENRRKVGSAIDQQVAIGIRPSTFVVTSGALGVIAALVFVFADDLAHVAPENRLIGAVAGGSVLAAALFVTVRRAGRDRR